MLNAIAMARLCHGRTSSHDTPKVAVENASSTAVTAGSGRTRSSLATNALSVITSATAQAPKPTLVGHSSRLRRVASVCNWVRLRSNPSRITSRPSTAASRLSKRSERAGVRNCTAALDVARWASPALVTVSATSRRVAPRLTAWPNPTTGAIVAAAIQKSALYVTAQECAA